MKYHIAWIFTNANWFHYSASYYQFVLFEFFAIFTKPRILSQCRIFINRQGLGASQMVWTNCPNELLDICGIFSRTFCTRFVTVLLSSWFCINQLFIFVDFWHLKEFRLWLLILNLYIMRPKSVHQLNLLAFDFFHLPVFDTVFYAGQNRKTFQNNSIWFKLNFKFKFSCPFQSKQVKQPCLDLNFSMLSISMTSDDDVKTRNES